MIVNVCFSRNISGFHGLFDPSVSEVLACWEALALAHDLQLTRIIVATDCLEVIECLRESYMCKFIAVLQEIKMRAMDFALG